MARKTKSILMIICIIFTLSSCENKKSDAQSNEKQEKIVESDSSDSSVEWIDCYKHFLENKDNFREQLSESVPSEIVICNQWWVAGFFLHDINNDNVPELFIETEGANQGELLYVYTYDAIQKNIKKLGGIENIDVRFQQDSNKLYYDSTTKNSIANQYQYKYSFGYNSITGEILSFECIGNQNLVISCKVYDNNLNQINTLTEEQTNDSYTYTKGKRPKSITDFKNNVKATIITKEEFQESYKNIMQNYLPIKFYNISEENIRKYVVSNYSNSGINDYLPTDCMKDCYDRYLKYNGNKMQCEDIIYNKSFVALNLSNMYAFYSDQDSYLNLKSKNSENQVLEVYRRFLLNYKNVKALISDNDRKSSKFYIKDLNNDNIPELLISTGNGVANYICFYKDGAVIQKDIFASMALYSYMQSGIFEADCYGVGNNSNTYYGIENNELKILAVVIHNLETNSTKEYECKVEGNQVTKEELDLYLQNRIGNSKGELFYDSLSNGTLEIKNVIDVIDHYTN